jgi:hypothetical protein
MPRLILGGVLGGLAMWFVGFLFWGTPLSLFALSKTDDTTTAVLQQALGQHLGPLGTGAYPIPWIGTPTGTQLFGHGPTAMVFFNSNGFANPDTASLITGLVLAIICVTIAGFALRLVAGGLNFADRLKLVALVAVAVTAYSDLGQPVFNHMPVGYFVYLWLSDVASWVAAGAVLAWALPRRVPVTASEQG